jgi:hypothetical protein
MKLYKYKNNEEYISCQKKGVYNHPALGNSVDYEWVNYPEIQFIKNNIINPHFDKLNITPKKGICHGAKLGKENKWFEEVTGVDFIGTDISTETNEEMKLIQWDFHKVKNEWKNNIDIIYSNSLDHSYDPNLVLRRWVSCLTLDGICIIEWSKYDSEESYSDTLDGMKVDCFGASLEEYKTMIESAGTIVSTLDYESQENLNTGFVHKTFIVFKK